MNDVPISGALLLWNSGLNGGVPAFAVRPLGHPDYDRYQFKVGACFRKWRESDNKSQRLQLLVDAWHIVAFYDVPVALVREGLLVIPDYRDMLAGDCLPKQFQNERE
ncbi:MAG: hypothetical protein ACRYHC_01700 [Janthinobacterium lividum]